MSCIVAGSILRSFWQESRSFSWAALAAVAMLGMSACSDSGDEGDTTTTTSTSSTDGSETHEGSNSHTTSTSSGSESGDTDSSGDSPKENGEECQGDSECVSGICSLAGICSECRDDAGCKAAGKLNCTTNSDGIDVCSTGELGEQCGSNDACALKLCHENPFDMLTGRGLCSSCTKDQDCQDSGQGKSCTPVLPEGNELEPLYWECGAGELGDSCEADTSCADGLMCGTFSLIGNEIKTCGKCKTNADCAADTEVCNIKPNIEEKKGYFECVAIDSLPQDTFCTIQVADASDACVGFCVQAEALGSPVDGVAGCSECRPDHAEEDCGAGKTCSDTTVDLSGMISGSKCG